MVIDFHAHLFPTSEGRERLLKAMEENAISQTVVVAGGVVSPQDLSEQIALGGGCGASAPNESVRELCAETRGKLLPFYFANPHASPAEYQTRGHLFYGLKLGPAVHGVELNDPRNHSYVAIAERFNHSVYLHCLSRVGFDTRSLLRLSNHFPKVTFVLGHAGIGNCDFYSVDQIAAQDNIYFETSGGFSSVIGYALKKLGEDRVLFGSEFPLEGPEVELAKYRRLNVDMVKLSTNALRLLTRVRTAEEGVCRAN